MQGVGGGGGPGTREVPPSRRGLALALVLVMIAAIVIGAGALMYSALTGGTKTVTVPPLQNQPVGVALATLAQAGLRGVTSTEFSDSVAAGLVSRTDPTDGTKVQPKSTVLLVVSSGAQTGPVPDVTGKSLTDAESAITAAGFKVGTIQQEFSPTVPQNNVTRTDPAKNTPTQRGASITIYQSGGKQPGTLTDVTGFDQAQAQKTIHDEGFNAVPVTGACDASKPANTVLTQTPQGGPQVPTGSDVTITINQAKAVPDVTTMSQTAATSALQQAGFKVQTQTSLLGAAGTVVDQSPKGGTTGCANDTVTIVVGQGLGGTSPSPSASASPSTTPLVTSTAH